MTIQYRAVLLIALMCVGPAYPAGVSYVGDGRLIDHGKHRLTNRYEVILGTVDIGSGGRKAFKFRGLPHREFVLGLRLSPANCGLEQSAATISFAVANERGETVIHEERPLHDLVWQRTLGNECDAPFGYIRGSAANQGASKSNCSNAASGSGTDQGRGTYFVARTDAAYEVTVIVSPPTDRAAVTEPALVVLQDNGAPPPPANCN
jgi:hypothetical protein